MVSEWKLKRTLSTIEAESRVRKKAELDPLTLR
jgi:hypothetical protein